MPLKGRVITVRNSTNKRLPELQIKHSAPDRAPCSLTFTTTPNHSGYGLMGQESVVEKSILHVDEGEGVQTNIKRGTSNPEWVARKNGQQPEPPSPPPGERLLERIRCNYVWTPRKTIVRWPGLSLSNPRSTNDIVWTFLRANPTLLWVVTNCVLTTSIIGYW